MQSTYSVGERYEQLIRQLVDSGRCANASEVVRDGLRLLEEVEQACAEPGLLTEDEVFSRLEEQYV